MIWIVMISKEDGYVFHSAHATANAAEEWGKCKQFDGEDVTILHLVSSQVTDLTEIIENLIGK